MTKDELKTKLKSAWWAQKRLESDLMELQTLRDNANKITPAYSIVPGGSSSGGQKLENYVTKIVDMEACIHQDMEDLVDRLKDVRSLISLVDDPIQKLVLQRRYLNYQKWEVIAADLGYSWAGVHKIHSCGLTKIFFKSR